MKETYIHPLMETFMISKVGRNVVAACFVCLMLTRKAPNTTIAEFANTADPDETAHNEPSHLDLQCLPSSL